MQEADDDCDPLTHRRPPTHRYMRAGSLVVELHGAKGGKYGDTTIFSQSCSGSCGLLHAPYGVPGAFPRDVHGGVGTKEHPLTYKYDHPKDAMVARVEPSELVHLLEHVFPADPCALPDWVSVFSAYNAFLAKQPHPKTRSPLQRLSSEYTNKRFLPKQYRTPPWYNRTATRSLIYD
jgi:hypothetical protein